MTNFLLFFAFHYSLSQNSTLLKSSCQLRAKKNISYSEQPNRLLSANYFLSFLQYCVQSLSVHSEHRRAILLFSQKRSGYISTHNSHMSHTTNANPISVQEKKLFNATIGKNIIKWSQLNILQVVQHLLCIMSLNGHQIRTQIKSHT